MMLKYLCPFQNCMLDWHYWMISIVLVVLHVLYLVYGYKYVRMKSLSRNYVVLTTFISVVICYVILLGLNTIHYLFNINSFQHPWHIRIETGLYCIAVIFLWRLYRLFGGMKYKDLMQYAKAFVLSVFRMDFTSLNSYHLFSTERMEAYIEVKEFSERIDLMINLIHSVTDSLVAKAERWKVWSQYTNEDAEDFLNDIGDMTNKYYKIIKLAKLNETSTNAFFGIIDSKTPFFDKRLKKILVNSDYSNIERKDEFISALESFGNELSDEVINLAKVLKENR